MWDCRADFVEMSIYCFLVFVSYRVNLLLNEC